jgi:hypothetical protein
MEQLRGHVHLTLHGEHLLANAARGVVRHQVQVKQTGFQIAERLAQIVNQAVQDLVRGYCGAHVAIRRVGISIAQR